MGNIKIISICVLFLINSIYAQEGWFWQNPLPQGSNLKSVCFIDETNGWAVGGKVMTGMREGWSEARTFPSSSSLLRTTDGGFSWQAIDNEILTGLYAVDFINADAGWAVGGGGTIVYTTDGGNTWERSENPTSNSITVLNAVQFTSENDGFVCGYGTFMRTTNRGENWEKIAIDAVDSGINFESLCFTTSSSGWMTGSNRSLLKTSDGGLTWTKIPLEKGGTMKSICFIDENTGWVAGSGSSLNNDNGVLYKTIDGGDTWFLQVADIIDDFCCVKFGNDNLGVLLGESGAYYVSSDGGETWQKMADNVSGYYSSKYDLNSVSFQSHSVITIVGNTGRIFTSRDNGLHWDQVSNGSIDSFNDCYFINDQTGWAVGETGTVLKTTDSGDSWMQMTNPYEDEIVDDLQSQSYYLNTVFFTSELVGYIGGRSVYKSTDGGESWVKKSEEGLHNLFFISADIGWGVSGTGKIIKTTDSGESWTLLNSGITNHLFSVFFIDENTGWICGWNSTILKTTDGGETWTRKMSGGTQLHSIYFISAEVGWAAGGNGVILKTIDGGESWETQNSTIDTWFYSIRFTTELKGWVAGMHGQIVKTTDGGETWTPVSNPIYGQGLMDINALYFVSENSGWAVGNYGIILKTFDGGNAEIHNPFTEVQIIKNTPEDFVLKQNYPNPFNPVTTLEYTIPQISESRLANQTVSLTVYDVLGRQVATIINGYQTPGNHTALFDGSRLATGIYFCKLSYGPFSDVKKLMLIK